IFPCLPHLHSATTNNSSIPICPESFSCPGGLLPFSYPFYNVTDTRCGLIKVNCNLKGGGVQLGGRSYEIVGNIFPYNLVILNRTFEQLVKSNSCEALMNTFSFPMYLPVKPKSRPGLDETNIFSLLSSNTSIIYNLSPFCSKCGHQCDTENGQARCLDVKREKTGAKQSRNRTITILVIAGSALILMLTFVIIIWRLCKSNRFSYVSSKNKYPNLEDISFSFGVSVFSYEELEDATQNFDPSHELGDGGFGAVYYGENLFVQNKNVIDCSFFN
ncbi:hypothetical protein M8C21_031436, partial [Ambrosia artemisiifolia]